MLPPLGVTPPPYSNIADISANYYEWISTNFSAIGLLTRRLVLGEKMKKYRLSPSRIVK